MTRAELLERMSSRELSEWRAYEAVTGQLGAERHDTLAAMIAYYVVSGLGAKNADVTKMLPQWDRPAATDWRQMKAAAIAATRAMGGDVS